MAELKKRKKELKEEAEEIASESKEAPEKKIPIRFEKVVSTGSTLLDLAISGKRKRGGGLPAGILVEIAGPSGAGKTTVLMEIAASTQYHGGSVRTRDPEARLDEEYHEMHGLDITSKLYDYARPNTVKELFTDLWDWEPNNPDAINLFLADSVAALSTDMEMEDEDKRGQRQAKEFSQSLRKSARKIGESDKLVVFANQLRVGEFGEVTACGKAIEYYASLRIRVRKGKDLEVTKKNKAGKDFTHVVGIISNCYIQKSTVDVPYRTAPIHIVFNRGIDDVSANLQWYKDAMRDTTYDAIDKSYKGLAPAVRYIEENNLEKKLRRRVIDLWEEIEDLFKEERKPKCRW
jgi:RecA/RadA recombinase